MYSCPVLGLEVAREGLDWCMSWEVLLNEVLSNTSLILPPVFTTPENLASWGLRGIKISKSAMEISVRLEKNMNLNKKLD